MRSLPSPATAVCEQSKGLVSARVLSATWQVLKKAMRQGLLSKHDILLACTAVDSLDETVGYGLNRLVTCPREQWYPSPLMPGGA